MLKNIIIFLLAVTTIIFATLFVIYYNNVDSYKKDKEIQLVKRENVVVEKENIIQEHSSCKKELTNLQEIIVGIQKLVQNCK